MATPPQQPPNSLNDPPRRSTNLVLIIAGTLGAMLLLIVCVGIGFAIGSNRNQQATAPTAPAPNIPTTSLLNDAAAPPPLPSIVLPTSVPPAPPPEAVPPAVTVPPAPPPPVQVSPPPAVTVPPVPTLQEPLVYTPQVVAYVEDAGALLRELNQAGREIGRLLRDADLSNPAWQAQLEAAYARIRDVHTRMQQLTPPPELASVHATLLEGTGSCNDATVQLSEGLNSLDGQQLERGGTMVRRCTVKIAEAIGQLARLSVPPPE